MIVQTCHVRCTACNRYQSIEPGETAEEARDYAWLEGWSQRIVPNGSVWDICPKCLPNFKQYKEVK